MIDRTFREAFHDRHAVSAKLNIWIWSGYTCKNFEIKVQNLSVGVHVADSAVILETLMLAR